MGFQFDCVLVGSSVRKVNDVAAEACVHANTNARSRLLRSPIIVNESDWWKDDRKWIESDGGCVPNSYGSVAFTSVSAVVWFTDCSGRRHVRVVGGRVMAPRRSRGLGSVDVLGTQRNFDLGKTSHVELVYPKVAIPRILKSDIRKYPKEFVAIYREAVAEPGVSVHRFAAADWLEEHWPGETTLAKMWRDGAGLVKRLIEDVS